MAKIDTQKAKYPKRNQQQRPPPLQPRRLLTRQAHAKPPNTPSNLIREQSHLQIHLSAEGRSAGAAATIVSYASCMKMSSERRAIDKIYKRRDRYEIPDWQRGKVWGRPAKQALIDSILHGWRLPKFYFVKVSSDHFLVEDGQQRLEAMYEFFAGTLPLSDLSAKYFGARYYRDLPADRSDAYDDFDIDIDLIEDASDEELKDFFQRLQAGTALNSSEKLNAVHSKLRDFCKNAAEVSFLAKKIAIPDTRYAHFDIMAKVSCIEIEGLDSGLRLDDVKTVFEHQSSFSESSATAKRIKASLKLLDSAFPIQEKALRTRSVVQSLITLTCRIILTGKEKGKEEQLRAFIKQFLGELSKQVELGQAATDSDYLAFQASVNANVKSGARTRHEILLRKLFQLAPSLAAIFDSTTLAEAGVAGRVRALSDSIGVLIGQVNERYASTHGEDLFKATNKTTQALLKLKQPVDSFESYKEYVDNLYFVFREGPGSKLVDTAPQSFRDVNELRTESRHDVDHGANGKVRTKRKKLAGTFIKYAGSGTPTTLEPTLFVLIQANILGALEGDLRGLLLQYAR